MTPSRSRARRVRRGATALEFALVVPAFLLVMAAIVDFGWLFFTRSLLDAAATRGCRAGALIDPGEDEADLDAVRERAEEVAAQVLLEAGGIECDDDEECSVEITAFGTMPGRSIQCTVRRRFRPLIGLVLRPLTQESTMVVRLEWQRG